MGIQEKLKPFLSRLKSDNARPPGERYYALILAILIAYIISDLGLLYIRPMLLPKEAPPIKPRKQIRTKVYNLADYNIIKQRNIFNEDGEIPAALGASKDDTDYLKRQPVPSQLPIQLLGTIVHFNPKLSIATVNFSSKNASSSYKVDEDMEGLAKVVKIERKKLIFVNNSNRQLEYVEIPEDQILNFGLQASSAPQSAAGIEQRGRFDFSIKRTELDGLTQNLSALLQQARVEAVFSPDGVGVEGFRFVNIQPGSVYEKLGLKVGDMIKSVNREAVNSPTKGMELYNALKSSNSVQVGIERDGREEILNYSIQ